MSERIEIEAVNATGGPHYRVWWCGKVLIQRARDPEHDACRALLAKGVTGTLTTYWRGSDVPCMRLNVKRAAAFTVTEGVATGPRIIPWREYPANAHERSPESCAGEPQTGKHAAAATTLAET